jgi:hypothetical protein
MTAAGIGHTLRDNAHNMRLNIAGAFIHVSFVSGKS